MNPFCKRLLFVFCALFLVGASEAVEFNFQGVKGKEKDNIESRLQEYFKEHKPASTSHAAIEEQIKKALYPYGYFVPLIKNLRVTNKSLSAEVYPGTQIKVTSLAVEVVGPGRSNLAILQALRNIPLKQGEPALSQKYEQAKDQLINAAEHQGYLRANFTTARMVIDKKRNQAHIQLTLDTGPLYYFGQVRFDPTYICPELLHRYIPFRQGQPYSTDEVLSFESSLSSSGYFKSVVVKPQIDSEQSVPIDVHLERVHRINYTLGVGYGTDTGPRGRAGVHVVPVNRAGHKFNAIAQGSFKENAVLAQYVIPGRNPITDKYSLTGSLSNLDYTSGYSNAATLSFAHQHATSRHQRALSLNLLNERFNYTRDPKTTKTVFYPAASLTWLKTTDPLFSPSGYNLTINGLGASRAVLSSENMVQGVFDAKGAFTIDPIRTRFFFHTIQGRTAIKNINNLPLSLAMLLGGAENLKGYSFNSIGPGKIMTYGGVEIQKETFDNWYLIGFYDTGDVYQPTPMQAKYDAGVGLMWVSPVGPIKIGVAQAITSKFQRIRGRQPKLVINMGPDL